MTMIDTVSRMYQLMLEQELAGLLLSVSEVHLQLTVIDNFLELAASGVDVAVADIPSKKEALDQLVKEIQTSGRKAITVTGDVSKESDVQAIVQKTVEAFGGLGIVCTSMIWLTIGFILSILWGR